MNLRKVFTNNLKFHRKRLSLTQAELAELCNIATNYMSEIETGKKFPSIELIQLIAEALKIPPHLLFVDTTEEIHKIEQNDILIEKKRNKDFSNELIQTIQNLLQKYNFLH